MLCDEERAAIEPSGGEQSSTPLAAAEGRSRTRAELEQRQLAARKHGAHSREWRLGLPRSTINRRIQKFAAGYPHLRVANKRGNWVCTPQFRRAVEQLTLAEIILDKVIDALEDVGVVTERGEPRRLLDTAKSFFRLVSALRMHLGVSPPTLADLGVSAARRRLLSAQADGALPSGDIDVEAIEARIIKRLEAGSG